MNPKNKRRNILIVAEKDRAAERIARILSKGNMTVSKKNKVNIYIFNKDGANFFTIGLKGHIFTTEFAKSVHLKGWENVDPMYLLRKAPLMKMVRKESRGVLKTLQKLVKYMDTLIIATDFDREGENIGMQVADMIAKKINKKIKIRRAKFSSLTNSEILKAFKQENLRDLNMNMVYASEVRQEIDLRMGVAFTRTATMAIQRSLGRPDFPMISIGPCQTPTLGLVVERYLDHLESLKKAEKEKKYIIKLVVNANGREVVFKSKSKFESIDEARELAKRLKNKEISIKRVVIKEKRIQRPLPLNTVRLASLSARVLGLSSKDTLNVAEKLYLEGLISYPRTETDKYIKSEENIAAKLFDDVMKKKILGVKLDYVGPRNGYKTDFAHPPIRPEKIVKFNQVKQMLKFERDRATKLYELIVRSFIANLVDNALVEELSLTGGIGELEFRGETFNVIEPGFLRVYPYHPLSPLVNKKHITLSEGDVLRISKIEVEEVTPPISQPLTESELIKLMDKLGIGTDATFAEHIHKIIQRKYVRKTRGHLIPTELGIAIHTALKNTVPELIDPKIRSMMEEWFTMVERGEMNPNNAVKQAIDIFSKMLETFRRHLDSFVDLVKKAILEMGINAFIKPRFTPRKRKNRKSKKKKKRR